MAKFYGTIGYIDTEETEPGIWVAKETARPYYGDVIRNTAQFVTSGGANDNINVTNEISIVADPFAFKKFHNMRYIQYADSDVKWKITKVEPKHPRIIISVGGIYNGEQA